MQDMTKQGIEGYSVVKALQVFLLCLFSFSSTINGQSISDEQLMARAARREGLDKTAAFQASMEAYRQEVMGRYLFNETLAQEQAKVAYNRQVRNRGDKQLLIRQIFHALPQHVRQTEINEWQQRMESIIQALVKGTNFEVLMNQYSDIRETKWISRLDVTAEVEEVAFALKKGQISQPFLSPQGIHIVQVIDERPLNFSAFNNEYVAQTKRQGRINKVIDKQVEQLKATYHYTEKQQTVNRLYRNGHVEGVLFTADGREYTGEQFARFAQTYPLGVRQQFAAFVTKSLMDCAAAQLNNNSVYVQTLQGSADRLLAQEAYRRHVVIPSRNDEAGLKSYFSSHQKDYRWQKPKFRGAVIHAVDKKTAKKVSKVIKKLKGGEWTDVERKLDAKTISRVKVDLGVFAPGDNAFVDELEFGYSKAAPLAGYPVALTVGKKLNGPDNYNEVREQLQQDYEQYLSKEWLARLRKQK